MDTLKRELIPDVLGTVSSKPTSESEGVVRVWNHDNGRMYPLVAPMVGLDDSL